MRNKYKIELEKLEVKHSFWWRPDYRAQKVNSRIFWWLWSYNLNDGIRSSFH